MNMKPVTYKELQEIMFKDTLMNNDAPITGTWDPETETMKLIYKNYFCIQTEEEMDEIKNQFTRNDL